MYTVVKPGDEASEWVSWQVVEVRSEEARIHVNFDGRKWSREAREHASDRKLPWTKVIAQSKSGQLENPISSQRDTVDAGHCYSALVHINSVCFVSSQTVSSFWSNRVKPQINNIICGCVIQWVLGMTTYKHPSDDHTQAAWYGLLWKKIPIVYYYYYGLVARDFACIVGSKA